MARGRGAACARRPAVKRAADRTHLGEAEVERHAADPTAAELAILRERLHQTEQRLFGLQQIAHIGQLAATDPDLDGVLQEIVRRTAALMECERATLYLLADDGRTLTARVPTEAGAPHTIALAIGQGIAGWVAEHGRAVNVKDAYRDPRFDPAFDRLTGFRTASILCQPMRDRHERVLGVVQALNKRAGYFTTTDEALLEAIANQAAVVIRNARLFDDLAKKHHALLDAQVRLHERNSEMDLMFAIERAAAVARDLDEALDGALQATLSEYPCEAAAVILLADHVEGSPAEKRRWRVKRASGEAAAGLEGASGLAVEPLLCEALVHGRSLVLFDAPHLPELPEILRAFDRIETLACVPLTRSERGEDGEPVLERVLGALVLVNSRRFPRCYDELDLHKLGVIAGRMAMSVKQSRTREEERRAERMAAIGGALSGIVHDLRTPLTLLDGYARMLSREAAPEERQALRDRHKRQIALVNGMIQDVLAFARGQSQVLPRKVWVREFLAEVEEALRIELEGGRVALTVDAHYKGAVRMDDAKMKRVITNLARNAREAMGAEGGALRIVAAEVDGRLHLSVSDTGPGIPKAMEDRLFESFATFGKAHGTGLGLAIVKTIVDQHEGTLEVASRPGEGTTFVIGLPLD